MALLEVEVPAQIEQGDLTDLPADACGADQTIGEIGFAGGFVPRRGFADEHGARLPGGASSGQYTLGNIMALHSRVAEQYQACQTLAMAGLGETGHELLKMG